ncbi:MAG: hypothetical protein H3C47_00780 [Candidatus Cloacimonetes bacterium]|nr:hypothetical protein [Candidatus Cloacimonadota bacterium]
MKILMIFLLFCTPFCGFSEPPSKTLYDFIRPEDKGALEELEHLMHGHGHHGHVHPVGEKPLEGTAQAVRGGAMDGEVFLFYFDIPLMAQDLKKRTILVMVLLLLVAIPYWKIRR